MENIKVYTGNFGKQYWEATIEDYLNSTPETKKKLEELSAKIREEKKKKEDE